MLGGLGVGLLTGTINGLVVTRIKVNPLIATLGMMSVARGIALGFTEGHPVINIPKGFAVIGQGSVFGIPLIIIYMVVIVVIADILLRRGRAFRQLYYVGSSEKAAAPLRHQRRPGGVPGLHCLRPARRRWPV